MNGCRRLGGLGLVIVAVMLFAGCTRDQCLHGTVVSPGQLQDVFYRFADTHYSYQQYHDLEYAGSADCFHYFVHETSRNGWGLEKDFYRVPVEAFAKAGERPFDPDGKTWTRITPGTDILTIPPEGRTRYFDGFMIRPLPRGDATAPVAAP